MLETIRTLVQTHTSGLTDGQFFGLSLLVVFVCFGLFILGIEAFRSWRIDYRLRKHLRGMKRGGLR